MGCCAPHSLETFTEVETGMAFVLIPAGDFVMGSPEGEIQREGQESEHEVRLTSSFYLGVHEVTQSEWHHVMGTEPSHFSECGSDCPVENVNFFDIEAFVDKLNALSGENFRLPTEAEWEFACRAGTSAPFRTGSRITSADANINGETPYDAEPTGDRRGRTLPVGSFQPNDWGLHDMHGNVWEWVEDLHCPYPERPVTDPVGACASELRVIRGGSWYFGADSARCALRYTHRPEDIGISLGFRLAKDP